MGSLSRAAMRVEPLLHPKRRSYDPLLSLVTAARLVSQGVNVVPIKKGTKSSLVEWKDLQDERIRDVSDHLVEKYLHTYWGNGVRNGIGVVTGFVSGLVVVDIDGEDGQALFEALAPDVRTPTVVTKSGRHYWFAHPGSPVTNRSRVQGVHLDVRGDRGLALCPPTEGYRWLISPFVQDSPAGMWPPSPLPSRLSRILWPRKRARKMPEGSEVILRRGSDERYAWAALDAEAEIVRFAPEGTRNHQLNESVWKIARFIREGKLSESDVRSVFLGAARVAGLPDHEAERTIESAIRGRS